MLVETTRFGSVEVGDDRAFEMRGPILGFPEERSYVRIDAGDGSPFQWLQSTSDPDVAFVAVDPFLFFADYDFELPAADQTDLGLESVDDAETLVLVTIPEEASRMTANLLAPIVLNRREGRAKQVVLYDTEYTTRHYLLPQPDPKGSAPQLTVLPGNDGP